MTNRERLLNVMNRELPDCVPVCPDISNMVEASKKAIDDAADGGGFVLSTGDQCGRDTPDEYIFAMVETARTYGKY